MSFQNIYLKEKNREYHNKRRIISLNGEEIGFKLVHGNRKDVVDTISNKEQVFDNMENRMKFRDICKQYNLFFNKKLRIYDKKYLNDLADILDTNHKDYIKERKLIESQKNMRLHHSNKSIKNVKTLNTIETSSSVNIKKKNNFNTNFKTNKKFKKINDIPTEETIKNTLNDVHNIKKEKTEKLSKRLKIKKIKSQSYLFSSISSNKNYKKIERNDKYCKIYLNKISKKHLNSDLNQNYISLFRKSEKNKMLKLNKKNNSSYFSHSNFNNKHSSYFEEEIKEKSYVCKKIRNEKLFPLGRNIKTIEIIQKKPILFQKPFSILGEFYISHKLN